MTKIYGVSAKVGLNLRTESKCRVDRGFCRVVQEPFLDVKPSEVSSEMIPRCLDQGVGVSCMDLGPPAWVCIPAKVLDSLVNLNKELDISMFCFSRQKSR